MYMEGYCVAEVAIQKQKINETFAMALLPFSVALLAIVKNDLIIAW